MLKELFEAVCGRAEAAALPKQINNGDVRAMHFFARGECVDVEIPPPNRNHKVRTLEGLLLAVERYGTDGALWHDQGSITLVTNDCDRREFVTMPLTLSEHWKIVSALGTPLTQRDFVRLLRHDLRGCVPDTLLPAVAKIEVATSSGQRNEINPGRERGSREFAVELATSGEIPEHFTAMVNVYANEGLRQLRPIICSLDYSLPPAQVAFVVKPLPDQLELALQDAQRELHEYLTEKVEIPVFCGTP